ncbi:MAG: PD40 domain-containing protein [Candidatus Eisenbacteria bacterium]|nr:PD40 domain-containing protein [Candidatus Eisenbacteria bacterium]
MFAPGWVSLPNRFEYCLIFSPALDECVFGQTNSSWGGFGLHYTRMNLDGTWTDPTSAPFQGDGDACYPTFSPDGQSLRFASSRPSYPPMRIWSVARDTEGWQAPEALDPPVFSGANEGIVAHQRWHALFLFRPRRRPGGRRHLPRSHRDRRHRDR